MNNYVGIGNDRLIEIDQDTGKYRLWIVRSTKEYDNEISWIEMTEWQYLPDRTRNAEKRDKTLNKE